MHDVTNTLRGVMIERGFYTLVNFIRSSLVNMIYMVARSGNYLVLKMNAYHCWSQNSLTLCVLWLNLCQLVIKKEIFRVWLIFYKSKTLIPCKFFNMQHTLA